MAECEPDPVIIKFLSAREKKEKELKYANIC